MSKDIIVDLSKRVQAIKPSPTLAVTARAARLKAEGKDIIGLGAGEPDFDTPQHIKDAAITAINKGLTKYTAVGGTPSLKNAIMDQVKKTSDIRNIELETIIDETIIGGFVLQAGDKLIDASISYDLREIARQFENNDFIYNIR